VIGSPALYLLAGSWAAVDERDHSKGRAHQTYSAARAITTSVTITRFEAVRRGTLFIPDRRGNNRIDGLKNLVQDPRIGLIFFVPGVNETFRVNGCARISQDNNVKRRFIVKGKEPTTVLIITVEEAFQHCAKALVRSDLWKAGARGRPQGVPTMGEFVATRYPGTDSATIDASYSRQIPNELY
jgi:PPOX class probable FMN-dependent enzyme